MAACCATTSGAASRKTPRDATSPSMRSTTIRPAKRCSTTTTASRDLQHKTLRMIGDPRARYREDPVRMLRAVRLAAKLDLRLDPMVQAPIREMAELMENVPAARLFDEMLKLLFSGHAVECVKRLREDGLHHGLLPLLDVILEQPLGEKFVMLSLASTDERDPGRQAACRPASCSPPCSGTKCWPTGRRARRPANQPCRPCTPRWTRCSTSRARSWPSRARIAGDIKDIWSLQPRFEKRTGRAPGSAHRATALPRRLGFPGAARRERRSAQGIGRLVGRVPGCRLRAARGHAAARYRRRSAAADAGRGRKESEEAGSARRRGGVIE